MPRTWPVQDAKSRFSEFVNAALTHGPQIVSRRGSEVAVLVPITQWRRLEDMSRPDLKELLLTHEARTDDLVPARRARRHRMPPLVD